MEPPSDSVAVAGIILAAGSSSRIGRPKQLLPINGKALIRIATETALASRLAPIIVVTGNYSTEVEAQLQDLDVVVINNPRFLSGQASSMIAGLAAIPETAAGVVFLLADQPELTSPTIDRVVETAVTSDFLIVQARYRGTPAHPVYLGRALFPELNAVNGDQGAREVLRRHNKSTVWVDIDSDPPRDVDTEADYLRLRTDLEHNR